MIDVLPKVDFILSSWPIALNCFTEPGSKKQTSSREIWQAVDTLIRFFTQLLKTTSQLALIVHISRSAGGPLFALMCIARPLFSALFAQALWDKTCIAFWNDQDHTRMKSLENLANEDQYKEQVFSGNLSNWILTGTFPRCLTARFFLLFMRFPFGTCPFSTLYITSYRLYLW